MRPPDPHLFTDLLIGMVGAGGFSFVVGCYLLFQAWGNLRDGSVPLTSKVRLTGCAGRVGATVLLSAGFILVATSAVLFILSLWRLAVWLTAGR
jgi:hypothetical protein